jgi:hypothetical protein
MAGFLVMGKLVVFGDFFVTFMHYVFFPEVSIP